MPLANPENHIRRGDGRLYPAGAALYRNRRRRRWRPINSTAAAASGGGPLKEVDRVRRYSGSDGRILYWRRSA